MSSHTLAETRIKDVGQWCSKHVTSPGKILQTIKRSYNSYRRIYVLPRYAGPNFLFHSMLFFVITGYMIDYSHLKKHDMQRKYH